MCGLDCKSVHELHHAEKYRYVKLWCKTISLYNKHKSPSKITRTICRLLWTNARIQQLHRPLIHKAQAIHKANKHTISNFLNRNLTSATQFSQQPLQMQRPCCRTQKTYSSMATHFMQKTQRSVKCVLFKCLGDITATDIVKMRWV